MVKKVLKITACTLLGIIIFALLVGFTIWAITPVYNFPEAKLFSGSKFYNPYKDFDNAKYFRGNFHGHSRLKGGVTNGKDNSIEDVFKAYRELEYGFATVSNYHHPTDRSYYDFPFIPAQEYGVNIFKTHFLLVGTKRREYFDQPIVQGPNTIQFRINIVRPHTEIIALAHPAFLNGTTIKDVEKVTGYDLIEVVNTFAHSVSHWDTALSSGRPAFLLASDDTHNVFINTDIGRNITMIPLDPKDSDKIYDTLKNGSAYGITVPHTTAMLDRKEKLKVLNSHPQLVSMQVDDNGTINMTLNKEMEKITFSSNYGEVRASFDNVSTASYKFQDNDSYVRATAYFDNGSIAYFNPIIRTDDGLKPQMPKVTISYGLTILKLVLSAIAIVIVIFLFVKLIRRKNK